MECSSKASRAEEAKEWAAQADERMDERMAHTCIWFLVDLAHSASADQYSHSVTDGAEILVCFNQMRIEVFF